MNSAFQTLTRHMDHHDFNYQSDPAQGQIRTVFGGRHASYHLILKVDDHLLQVFANLGFRVPTGARGQVAEAICRANLGLKIGKFEMDIDDGEIRFQAATALSGEQLTEGMIMLVMGATFFTLDRYVPALLSCIFGGESPEDCIRHADVM